MGAAEWAGLFGGLGRGLEGFGEHLRYQDERKQQRALEDLRQRQLQQQMDFSAAQEARASRGFAQEQELFGNQMQEIRDRRGLAAAKSIPINEEVPDALKAMIVGTPAEGYLKQTPAGGVAPETTELPPWLQQVEGSGAPGMLPAMTANARTTRRTMTDEKFTLDQIKTQIAQAEAARRAYEGQQRAGYNTGMLGVSQQAEARRERQGNQLNAIRAAASARGDRAIEQQATKMLADLYVAKGNLNARLAGQGKDPYMNEFSPEGARAFEEATGAAGDIDRFIEEIGTRFAQPSGAGGGVVRSPAGASPVTQSPTGALVAPPPGPDVSATGRGILADAKGNLAEALAVANQTPNPAERDALRLVIFREAAKARTQR